MHFIEKTIDQQLFSKLFKIIVTIRLNLRYIQIIIIGKFKIK